MSRLDGITHMERHVLLLTELRGSVTDADIRELAENEARAEIAVELGDADLTMKADTIERNPALVVRKRDAYAAALAAVTKRGLLQRTGDRYEADDDLLDEVAVDTLALNLGVERGHRHVKEVRQAQKKERAERRARDHSRGG